MDKYEHGSILHYIVIPTLHHSWLTAADVPSGHPPLPAAALDNATPYHFLSLSQSQCLQCDKETSPSAWLAAGSIVQNVAQTKLSNYDRLAA